MPDISVVMSTYNRAYLLERSLWGYAHQRLDQSFEIIVVDDDSTDTTAQLCYDWASDIDIKYIRVRKPQGSGWRDGDATRNLGLRAAKGKLITCTHPEVIPGRESLQQLWHYRKEKTYLCCKIYYLGIRDQELIDTVDWRNEGNLAVRNIPGFYSGQSAEVRQHSDYSHESTDSIGCWESWVFGAYTRDTWKWLGGWEEFDQWGSGDVSMLTRRHVLNIPNVTMMDPETFCIHQNHDRPVTETFVETPRDLDKAMAALPTYGDPAEALLKHLW